MQYLDFAAVHKCLPSPLEDTKKKRGACRFPGFCGREIRIARRISLHPFQNTVPVTLKRRKKKNTIYSSLERKPWATFRAPVSMGPYTGLTPVCRCLSCTGDTKPFPVSRFASPVLSRENYAFLRPAACGLASAALDRTDLHRCLCTSLPPLRTPGPLQHQSPSTSSPSFFSIQYLPYRSHASNLSDEHIPSLPSLL